MAFAAIRKRYPDYSEEQVRHEFIVLTYGPHLAEEIRRFGGPVE